MDEQIEIKKLNNNLTDENILDNDLVSFFDLLAQFDYEDNQKEKLVLSSDSLVSAPRVSEFGPNSLK